MIFQSTVDNPLGTKNNVMSVATSDFEVFEALAMDSVGSCSEKGSGKMSKYPPHWLLNTWLLPAAL